MIGQSLLPNYSPEKSDFPHLNLRSIISVVISNLVLILGTIFLSWGVNQFITISIIEIYISTIFGFLSLSILNRFAEPVNLMRVILYSFYFMLIGIFELLTLGAIFGGNIDINLPLIYIFLELKNAVIMLCWAILAILINHLISALMLILRQSKSTGSVSDSDFNDIMYRYFVLQLLTFFIGLVLATSTYSANLKLVFVFIILLKTFIDIFYRLRWQVIDPEIPW